MKRRVLAAVDDIFFAAKIRGTADALGVDYVSARDAAAALESARANPPAVVVADLHATRCDPFALAAAHAHALAQQSDAAKRARQTSVTAQTHATDDPEVLFKQGVEYERAG